MPTLLSPMLLVSSAMSLVDPPDTLRTPAAFVDRYLELAASADRDINGVDWSLPFVQYAGHTSHYDPRAERSSWPLPLDASCDALKEFAAMRGVLVDEAPRFGDVYLLWSRSKSSYLRAGIIVSAVPRFMPKGELAYDCRVIDANTDRLGWLHGPCTLVTDRRICLERHDRLVRWVDLELVAIEPLMIARAA